MIHEFVLLFMDGSVLYLGQTWFVFHALIAINIILEIIYSRNSSFSGLRSSFSLAVFLFKKSLRELEN